MRTINTELLERDYNWNIISSAPVKVIAWDRDKYFMYEDTNGERHISKRYHFSLKKSNQIYELPYIDYYVEDDKALGLIPVTRKEAQSEIKKDYKRTNKYFTRDKKFNSLKKAIRYITKNKGGDCLSYKFSNKLSWSCGPLLVLEGGEWCYCHAPRGVSEKTLRNA